MKLRVVARKGKDPLQGYLVEDIKADDIAPADEDFLDFVREVGGLSFINAFTIGKFNKEMRERFASPAQKEADTGCGLG